MQREPTIISHPLPKGLDRARLTTLLEWIHLVGQIEKEDNLKTFLDSLYRHIPTEHMALALGRLNQHHKLYKLEKIINVNYPSAWVEHYLSESYANYDPILQIPSDSAPIQWKERFSHARTSLEKRFVTEATAAGLGNGISFSAISQKHNLACITSISGEDLASNIVLVEMLHALTPHLQQAMIRITSLLPSSPSSALLSTREHDIFGWMSHGKTNWEIATILNISERTVKFHVANIIRKLNANNRTHAIVLGLQQGLQQSSVTNE